MDRLDSMAVFAAVCDAGGFASASRRLGLSPSVVTRLVAGLEERLGVRLLQRTTRSLHLTEAGAAYLDRVRRILGEVEDADEAARGERAVARGRLVVAAPVIFGRLHVAPLLGRLLDAWPEVTADLLLDDRNVSLVEDGVDVAVRIGTLEDSTLIARRLGTTRRVVVGSPAYLDRMGRPEQPADLGRHALIAFAPRGARAEWEFRTPEGGELRIPVASRLSTNGGDAALGLALDGYGLTRALMYQAAPFVAAGTLSVVLDRHEPPPSPIHALTPGGRLLPGKVRAFLELASREAWTFIT